MRPSIPISITPCARGVRCGVAWLLGLGPDESVTTMALSIKLESHCGWSPAGTPQGEKRPRMEPSGCRCRPSARLSIACGLQLEQLRVPPARHQQFLVRSQLLDPAVRDDGDAVRDADGREPVGDHDPDPAS